MSDWPALLSEFDRIEPSSAIPAGALARAAELSAARRRRAPRWLRPAAVGALAAMLILMLAVAAHSRRESTPAAPGRSATLDEARQLEVEFNRISQGGFQHAGDGRDGQLLTLEQLRVRVRRDLAAIGQQRATPREMFALPRHDRLALALVLLGIGIDRAERAVTLPLSQPPVSTAGRNAYIDARAISAAVSTVLAHPTPRYQLDHQALSEQWNATAHDVHRLVMAKRDQNELLTVFEARAYRRFRLAGLFDTDQELLTDQSFQMLGLYDRIAQVLRAGGTLDGHRGDLILRLRALRYESRSGFDGAMHGGGAGGIAVR